MIALIIPIIYMFMICLCMYNHSSNNYNKYERIPNIVNEETHWRTETSDQTQYDLDANVEDDYEKSDFDYEIV